MSVHYILSSIARYLETQLDCSFFHKVIQLCTFFSRLLFSSFTSLVDEHLWLVMENVDKGILEDDAEDTCGLKDRSWFWPGQG